MGKTDSAAKAAVASPLDGAVVHEGVSESARTARPGVSARALAGLLTFITYVFVGAVLYIGWVESFEEHMVPDNGLGYALGIAGGVMMLLLLLYPLRKTARFMRNWGAPKHWFRAHMTLGVAGPVLVVFHSNFSLGSLNSNVVLFATLIVSASGLVGRYIYAKVHNGLYGSRKALAELKTELESSMKRAFPALGFSPATQQSLLRLDAEVLKERSGLDRLFYLLTFGMRARLLHLLLLWRSRRDLSAEAARHGWSDSLKKRQGLSARTRISEHIGAAANVAELSFYERLLSGWHVFHLPLFILLVIAAVVHVIAVHMY